MGAVVAFSNRAGEVPSTAPGVLGAVLVAAALGLCWVNVRLALLVALAGVGVTALGETVGLAAYILIAGVSFEAGRRDGGWTSVAGTVLLVAGACASTAVAGSDSLVPFSFMAPAAWAAGRALREREVAAARLADRARELEAEREAFARLSVRYERARIAAELHDIVAHAVSVMVVQATAGQRLAAVDPARTAQTFGIIAGAARQAEEETGRLVALLAAEDAIAPAPDLAMLEELVARAVGSGLDVTLALCGDREGLPAASVELAYRVVRESLTNALRYASAAAVRVRVDGGSDGLLVEVTNGPAPVAAALAGTGTRQGLRGLRERTGAIGGSFDAGPTGDGGWHVRARLPRRVATGVAG